MPGVTARRRRGSASARELACRSLPNRPLNGPGPLEPGAVRDLTPSAGSSNLETLPIPVRRTSDSCARRSTTSGAHSAGLPGVPKNTDGGDVVRGFALTPVIAIRDSDEITAVWLVPQLVHLGDYAEREHPRCPQCECPLTGGHETRTGVQAGSTVNDERPPKTAFPQLRVAALPGVRRASRAVLSPSGFPSSEV